MKPSSILISPSVIKNGTLQIGGYKHAMVQIICASIAHNLPITIENVPLVDDTFILMKIIEDAGGFCTLERHSLFLDPKDMLNSKIPENFSKKIHGALYLMPAYLARYKEFSIGEAGGCQIGGMEQNGSRPIEHMFKVMREFGAQINQLDGYWNGKVNDSKLENIFLDISNFSQSSSSLTGPHISGATKTAILLMPLVRSLELKYFYFKTDMRDLLRFYNLIGYEIKLQDNFLRISSNYIENNKYSFELTTCISEVMTYFALAVHCEIELEILLSNVDSVKAGLQVELKILDSMGVCYKFKKNSLEIYKSTKINSVNIDVTNDSIQSDHLPFFVLMLLKANSPSVLQDSVWKERFSYVSELKKLGAKLTLENNKLIVHPSTLLNGNVILNATDTRSAAVIILASLTATDQVTINNLCHLYRGYEDFLEKLTLLNANISCLEN